MTGPLLRAKVVAARLNVSEPTVYALAHRGVLESVTFAAWDPKPNPKKTNAKPRTTIRFTEEAVAKFIEQHTRRAG